MPIPDIMINSVAFGERSVEIAFVEKRDNENESAGMMKNMVIDTQLVGLTAQVEEILDTLRDFIDAGYLAIRNPPKVLDPRRRVGRSPVYEDDDNPDNEENA